MRDKPNSTEVLSYSFHFLLAVLLGASVLLLFDSNSASLHAQVAPITPSGLNTQVNLSATPPNGHVQYDITGGTRPGGGTNLFHSFGDFNVPNHNIANFLNDSGLATSNILGRVTGGNISNIFGTVQTTGFGNANLFLMNPTGFLFGPNATVNVGGMVAFTSADYLRLARGVLFNAIPNATADALLSAAPVAAFGFLGSNPGAITVQGSQLSVTPGQSISLVGGNIAVQSGVLDDGTTVQPAGLSAPGGQINMASVSSPGEILTGTLAQAPNINGQSFGALGTIQISQQSVIDVSGKGGGTVLIRGGQFVLDNSTISANITGPGPVTGGVESIGGGIDILVSQNGEILTGSLLQTNVLGNATPGVTYGGVHIKADRIEIIGDPGFDFNNGPFTGIHSDVASGSTGGNSGPIKLEANSILVQDFVTIGTLTQGNGTAGDIILRTTGNLELNGPLLAADSISAGNAGNIELSSTQGNILMTNGPSIDSQAFGSGTVGHITVTAPAGEVLLTNFDIFSGAIFTHNQGTAGIAGTGGIQITAKDLTIVDSGIQIDNFTSVQPGDLIVNLSGSLNLSGPASDIVTTTRGPAHSADLNITAHDIHLTDGSFLSTESKGSGSGGQLNIFTQDIQLTNGGQIRSGSGLGVDPVTGKPIITSGSGGTIKVQGLASPAESILIDGTGSGIFTDTQGTGAGGNIFVNANSVTLQNGGTLSAATSGTAPAATGGTITIAATDVQLSNGALITAQTTGAGNAGNILVKADSVSITDGAQLTSSSSLRQTPFFDGEAIPPPTGNAGNVTIQGLASPAQSVLIDGAGSGIFTDTEGAGAGGNIFVNANSVTLQNSGTLSAATSGTNNGGDIQVDATAINLLTFASINTLSFLSDGSAGNIVLKATQQITTVDSFLNTDAVEGTGLGGNILLRAPTIGVNGGVLSATTSGTGHAGNVLLEGQQISLGASPFAVAQGADVFAGTIGSGHGGTVILRGLDGPSSHVDNVTISGTSRIHTLTGSDGSAGDITINAAQFTLTDHATLNADTFGSGGAGTITITATDHATVSGLSTMVSSSSDFGATGNAGQISVSAPTVMIENGGSISTNTTGEGNGGNINILASQSVTMTNGSSISASSTGPGNAGNILINAGQNYTSTDSAVTTQAAQASGGNITVLATNMVQLTNSQLNASVEGSSTTVGGNITIDPQYVILLNSQILAQATQGQGGAISITITNGGLYLPDANSVISASSQFGTNGTVTIQSPNAPISGQIQPLGKSPLLATTLLNQRCAALAGGEFSSFTVAGRDSLPTEPGSWLASPLALGLAGFSAGTVTEEGAQARVIDPAQETTVLSLRQIAPAGFLTQAFAVDSSASCTS